MITATIGRTFLNVYKEKHKKELTAKQFFEEEYWPIFYDSSKYMQWINNSPFDQISKRKVNSDLQIRKDTLKELCQKIEIKEIKDMSTVIGAPASDKKGFAVSSGQVTNIEIPIDNEDAYLSWIASGLCLGVGMYSILFNDEEILYDTFVGWKTYRALLDDKGLEKLKGNQINSWNGLWLNYRYSRYFSSDFDFGNLQSENFFVMKANFIELAKIKWSELMFNISRIKKSTSLIGYVHNIGDVNKTLGFYPFHFEKAETIKRYYRLLFGEKALLKDAKSYEALFGLKLYKACQFGSIGLQALQPSSLFEDIYKNKKINLIKFKTYKTWLLAMINKEDTLELTGSIARKLHLYGDGSKGTDRKAIIEKLLNSSKRDFLILWDEIVKNTEIKTRAELKLISDKVFYMSKEDFGYFIALLKLDFRYQQLN